MRLYRFLRILATAVMLMAVTLLALDVTGLLAPYLAFAAKLQFLPAVLSLTACAWGAGATVLAILLLTLFCGRVYCATVCPLGAFQDLIAWLRRRLRLGFHGYVPTPNRKRCRIAFLAAGVLAGACGLHFAFLAPYGIYARAVAVLGRPLARMANNALAELLQAHGIWTLRAAEVAGAAVSALVGAGGVLLVVALCAWLGGRLWCNAVCPVGTVLGGVAHFARHRVTIDPKACVGCRACERVCRAGCVDLAHHRVDTSRCVVCLDCVAACKKGALTWK